MYERLLNKNIKPTIEELFKYSKNSEECFRMVHKYMLAVLNMEYIIRFPYGNSYGWGMKYSLGKKHICDIFAEDNSFNIMIRLTNKQISSIDNKSSYLKKVIDNKYPCGEGGWLNYRGTSIDNLDEIISIIKVKLNN